MVLTILIFIFSLGAFIAQICYYIWKFYIYKKEKKPKLYPVAEDEWDYIYPYNSGDEDYD